MLSVNKRWLKKNNKFLKYIGRNPSNGYYYYAVDKPWCSYCVKSAHLVDIPSYYEIIYDEEVECV